MNTKLLRLILVVFLTTTALAACRFSGEIDVSFPPTDLRVQTNWWLADGDGIEYVICDNRVSQVNTSFNVRSSSQVERVDIQRRGVVQETNSPVSLSGAQLNREGNRVSFTMTFNAGTTPFSIPAGTLEPQAIVIVPIDDPAAKAGTLRLTYTVHMTDGAAYTFSPVNIDVWGGCESA